MMSFNCMIFLFHIGQRTTWMKVMGTKYSKGSIIITGLTYGNPVLGEVIRILISDQGIVVLCYERLDAVDYVKHLNAYRVVSSGEVDFIAQDQLVDYHPVGKHNGFGQSANSYFVVLRYRVDCMLE